MSGLDAATVGDPLTMALLFAAGLAAGAINVVAGGGSFLTLPILIFAGLPAGVANGTNRVGILLQNVAAVWSFRRQGVLTDPRLLALAVPPALLGAAAGTGLALVTSDELFRRLLALLMVVLSLASLWGSERLRKRARHTSGVPRAAAGGERPSHRRRKILLVGAFFLVGVYGGFVQAGVGFLVLAATSAAGLDLVRGNAVKVAAILAFTALSLAIFAAGGRVAWVPGLVMAAGTVIGGVAGARITVAKGHAWVRGAVTVAVIAFAVKLWFWG